MAETYPINIWVNPERFEALQEAGLGNMPKEVLAGMKVLAVPCNAEQRDKILKLFPMAKYDTATTKSIELLPKDVKDKIFEMLVTRKKLDVMDEFITSIEKTM
jgi:hypothetical protein